jgi:hypothetical protein
MTGCPIHDIEVYNTGTIILLSPLTNMGEDWLEEHLEDPLRWGRGFAVEPRYVEPILEGIVEAGLRLR